ncbi:MAG: hypothetical protein ACTSO8_02320 [Promethearchaeota archaeon]
MAKSNNELYRTKRELIDILFAVIQYIIMILNALFILSDFLFISLNILSATIFFAFLYYLWKIRNPFYPYITFFTIICYLIILFEILFDAPRNYGWQILSLIVIIFLFPWLIYVTATINAPIYHKDRVVRIYTTMTIVEPEEDREDIINGKDLHKKGIKEKRKKIRQRFNASTIMAISLLNTAFFLSTYLLDLLN